MMLRVSSILFIVTLLMSCGVKRSLQVVRANEDAFNTIGREWNKLNPCVTDSSVEVIFNPQDTVFIMDSSLFYHSSINAGPNPYIPSGSANPTSKKRCDSAIAKAFQNGVNKATAYYKANPVIKMVKVTDKQLVNLLREDIEKYKISSAVKEARIELLKKSNNKFIIIIVILGVTLISLIVLKLSSYGKKLL